jgi:hypothetical protein
MQFFLLFNVKTVISRSITAEIRESLAGYP